MLTIDPRVREIEVRAHQVVGVAEYRAPAGGAWTPLLVEGGSVSLLPLELAPGRTCSVRVICKDSLLTNLTIFGAWIRLFHEITRMDGTTFRIPLGYFRVNGLEVDNLAGAVTIHGVDIGAHVVDYALVSLAQGEVPDGQTTLTAINRMLTECVVGIVPWWTVALVNADGAPSVAAASRLQYDGSRLEAVQQLLGALSRRLTFPIDGTYAFRYRREPSMSDVPVVTIHTGDLGNLETLTSVMERAGIANVATINFRYPDGTQVRFQRSYTVGPTAAGGPFGLASIEANAPTLETDTDAGNAMDAALAKSVQASRDFSIAVAPIYGIEVGDVVDLVGRNGKAARAFVTSGSIPLTSADGGWSLRLHAFSPTVDVEEWVWLPRR